MNLVELTSLTGETPRQVRFLISEGFIPPPTGGRTFAAYGDEHVAAIRRYQALHRAGFRPSAIRLLLQGDGPVVVAIAPGVALHIDRVAIAADIDPAAAGRSVERALKHFATKKEKSDGPHGT